MLVGHRHLRLAARTTKAVGLLYLPSKPNPNQTQANTWPATPGEGTNHYGYMARPPLKEHCLFRGSFFSSLFEPHQLQHQQKSAAIIARSEIYSSRKDFLNFFLVVQHFKPLVKLFTFLLFFLGHCNRLLKNLCYRSPLIFFLVISSSLFRAPKIKFALILKRAKLKIILDNNIT